MKRRSLLALVLLAPFPAYAQTPPAAAPIAALNDGLLKIMRAGRSTPFATRVQTLQPLVEQAFDLQQILQNSVGLQWSSFAPQQKQDLLAAFTQWTVATWVANFNSDNGASFQVLPGTRSVGTDLVVQTRLVPTSGDPTRLDYVMRNTGGSWKAVDILEQGSISQVAVQRSDFRSLLRGGNPQALISNLREKAASLASG